MAIYQELSPYYATVFVLAVIFSFNQKINADADRGHCIWYGECQDVTPRGKLNCVYNGPAKPMTDPKALSRLLQYCPQLYAGNSTLTCCSSTQLTTMEQNMGLARELLYRCSSCFYNFLNIFCSLTCDPHQSTYVGVKTKGNNDKGVPTVLSVDYAMTTTFANGMYKSCKDVVMPSSNQPAISVLCGHPADDCTAKRLLDYLGSPSNGRTPFGIDFHVQDTPWSSPGLYTLNPMNTTAVPCYETFGNFSACSNQDCPAISSPLTPTLPNISVLYPWPEYRIEQLVVTRPANDTRVKHVFPAPYVGFSYFSSLFDKGFMHLLLDLQSKIQGITANYNGKTITLDDICFHGNTNGSCVIVSILEYWQNNETRIDEVIWDEYRFYVEADYLDHLIACHHTPNATNDRTVFNSTCLSTSGIPVDPRLVMRDGPGYTESRTFVISFIVKNSNKEVTRAAEAWEKAYTNFLTNFSSPNMTIKFSTKVSSSATVPHSSVITLLTFALSTLFIRKF
ncbi:Niemann-Pick C1 protein-like [Mizuhopecten yessoensis]|uniref:Niemann-Pick C1 protein-like n=1 Tax=Mizuhopecten yessoensis TaxID=6573 RepID=UPI000B45BDBF|nr:Niemann-Pick C1 protein-like [Mizuhopecten yessoensis]